MGAAPFVPDAFAVPLRLEQPSYVLRPLTTDDAERDYDAVMSSRESLRHVFHENDPEWPADTMTLQDNRRDLRRHQEDFGKRAGFTYTVETPDGRRCLGCVYIYPCDRGVHDARVHYWVRDGEKARGLDKELGRVLRRWLKEAWPFRRPVFPGRDVPWPEWNAAKAREDRGGSR